jgi:hypothetical protein
MKVRGNVLKSRLAFVRQRFGPEGVEAVLQRLPREDRTVLEGTIDVGEWYPFKTGERLDDAIAEVLGKNNSRIFEDMGATSAVQSLSGIQRFYLDPGNPQGFMLRAPLIYQVYYDKGWREYRPTGPNSGVMTTYEAETFSAADCQTVIGWHKKALEMCGAKNVQMVEEVCRARGGEFCRYLVSWD